ncbi:MAG: tRNA (guanine-N1)-methyltransferase [Flavobacteriaceae bacterium]|nr:tRNA (guanine-N1)-methyltransferase [Flavobacteriaceae bacterium]
MTAKQTFASKILIVFLGLLTWSSIELQAQSIRTQTALDSTNINKQFEYIIEKSGNYRANKKVYEVVRRTWLNKIRSNVLDSIKKQQKNLSSLNATIKRQQSEIVSLKSNLENTSKSLETVTDNQNNISFFGITLTKNSYKLLMWSIVIILLILLLLFVYKFRTSNILTQDAKSSLTELDKEFEEHRRRALEREQKVRRQLQDEINKQKNK